MTDGDEYGRDFQIYLSTGLWKYTLEYFKGVTCWDAQQIVIAPCKHTRDRLDTIIHETLHASCPTLSEREVERISGDIAKVVWRCQYRFTPTNKE